MVQVLWVLLYYMDAVLLEVTCIKFLVDSLGALGPMEYRYLSPFAGKGNVGKQWRPKHAHVM